MIFAYINRELMAFQSERHRWLSLNKSRNYPMTRAEGREYRECEKWVESIFTSMAMLDYVIDGHMHSHVDLARVALKERNKIAKSVGLVPRALLSTIPKTVSRDTEDVL